MIDETRLREIERDNEKLMSEGYGSRRMAEVIAALREVQAENGRLREIIRAREAWLETDNIKDVFVYAAIHGYTGTQEGRDEAGRIAKLVRAALAGKGE